MAFLDKLNNLAKNVGEKTNDVIEINRMNSKINNEKSAIEEQQKKIGEFYYNLYVSGQQLDEGVAEFCAAIDESNRIIKENEDAIQKLKDERESQKQEAAAEKEAEKEVDKEVTQIAGKTCSNCGHVNADEMNFCSQCGTKLEIEVVQEVVVEIEPQIKICSSCKAELPDNVAFCPQCGQKVE